MAQKTKPTGAEQDPGFQVNEDLSFQKRKWAVDRVLWAVIVLLVLAALLGLFGNGLLSSARVSTPGGAATLEYQRFLRSQAPTTLRVRLGPGGEDPGTATLWLDRAYLEGVRLQKITPDPAEVLSAPGRVYYTFRVTGPGEPLLVTFHLEADAPGSRSGRFGAGGPGAGEAESAEFWQFTYP